MKHPLYWRWKDMRRRCHNPKHKDFKNYGARGIRVCDEWYNSFKAYAKWIEEELDVDVYSEDISWMVLDRIENNGNYEPGNMRWNDASGSNANKRLRAPVTPRKMHFECTEVCGVLGFGA